MHTHRETNISHHPAIRHAVVGRENAMKFCNNLVPVFQQIIHFRRSIIGRRAAFDIWLQDRPKVLAIKRQSGNKKNMWKKDGEADIWSTGACVCIFYMAISFTQIARISYSKFDLTCL